MSAPKSDQQSEGYHILQRRLSFRHPSRATEDQVKSHPQWDGLTPQQKEAVELFLSRTAKLVPA